MTRLVTIAAVAALAAATAFAQSHDPNIGSGNIGPSISPNVELSPGARRGFIFVRVHCAECHAIDNASASPHPSAPPLRNLHIRYPVADLQRPLSEGIHPTMPSFQLTAGQLADVMAYLKTLER